MQILPALRKFNTVAFTVVLLMSAALAGLALIDWVKYRAEYNDSSDHLRTENEIDGTRIEAGDRILTLYKRTKSKDEFETDLRFVDGRNGVTTKLGKTAEQEMHGGWIVGIRQREQQDSGFGYFVLAKTGERSGQPIFDILFLRFLDMKSFTLASDILAADVNELDGKSFSMVMWDADDRARFMLFDADAGRVLVTRDLDMKGSVKSNSTSAPEAKFH